MIVKYPSILTGLIILLFSIAGKAQQADSSCFNYSETRQVTISRGLESNSHFRTSHIIRDLAYGEQKGMSEVTIRISYFLDVRIRKEDKNSCSFRLLINDVRAGEYDYRGFEVSDALTPDYIDFSCVLIDSYGLALHVLDFSGMKLSGNTTIVEKDFVFYDLDEITELRIEQEVFNYGLDAYARFGEKLSQVHNYYAAISIVDMMLDNRYGVYFALPGKRYGNCLRQVEINRVLNYLKKYNFHEVLALQQQDPGSYLEKEEQLARKELRYQAVLRNQAPEVYNINLNRLIDLPEKWVTIVDGYYKQRMQLEHNFATFYDSLVHVEVNNGLLYHEYKILQAGLPAISMPRKYWCQPGIILEAIITSFIRKANGYLEKDMYNKGLVHLLNARNISLYHASSGDRQWLDSLIHMTVNGIVLSYLDVAEKAIRARKPGMARDYLDRALEVAPLTGLPPGIISRMEHDYHEMLKAYYERAGNALVNGNLQEALNDYNAIDELCRQYDHLPCPELLDHHVRMAVNEQYRQKINKAAVLYSESDYRNASSYAAEARRLLAMYPGVLKEDDHAFINQFMYLAEIRYYISEGEKYLSLSHPDLAFRYFVYASLLEDEFGTATAYQLDSLITRVGLPVLNSKLEEVAVLIKSHEFTEAIALVKRVENLYNEYIPVNDEEMSRAIALTWAMLEQEQCIYTGDMVGYYEKRSETLTGEGKFHEALASIDEALEASRQYRDCEIYVSALLERKSLLEDAIIYEEMLDETITSYEEGEYIDLAKYDEIETFFRDHHLQDAGLAFHPLCNFASQSNNPGFVLDILNYCMEEEQYEEAFTMLDRARELDVRSKKLAGTQLLLGQKLAILHHSRQPGASPFVIINELTRNEKWFKAFRNSFLDTWSFLEGDDEK